MGITLTGKVLALGASRMKRIIAVCNKVARLTRGMYNPDDLFEHLVTVEYNRLLAEREDRATILRQKWG